MLPSLPKSAEFTDAKLLSNLKEWDIDGLLDNQEISKMSLDDIFISTDEFQLAKTHYPEMVFEIGVCYYLKKRYKRAMAWFWRAAIKNHLDSRHILANIIHHGIGVSANEETGRCWSTSQNNEGNVPDDEMNFTQPETIKNYQTHLPESFFEIGKKRNGILCYYVASLFDFPFSLNQSKNKALQWYQASSILGNEEAISKIENIEKSGLNYKKEKISSMHQMVVFVKFSQNTDEKEKILEMIYKKNHSTLISLLKPQDISKNRALIKEIDDVKVQIKSLKNDNKKLVKKQHKYKSVIKKLQTKAGAMNSKVKVLQKEKEKVEMYESSLSKLSGQLQVFKSDASNIVTSIASLQSKKRV
ncbi:hypothetical protein K501DRAFT_308384 [Backusella circina FSU 941]|nr:hypothetical protein K501DRAFT_308384 [Backusella circina FSU 941]